MQKEMSDDEVREKWNHRHSQADAAGKPAKVLTENPHLLPLAGNALDLACGRGGNALYLAEKTGLCVDAWDISNVAIDRVQSEAKAKGLIVNAQVKNISLHPPKAKSYDVIIVTHFLDRALASVLIEALRPDGLLFYQTFTQTAVSNEGPSSSGMRLKDNELLELFRPLHVCVYREEGMLGDVEQGWRNLAMLVAKKR